ncbi:hypothetical protein L596_022687 [Steinernema carpocapsae]|uniref:Peptidase M1 membrane alanine aminopeptidase domain-containing protein n=1 Tax=Steinernema carpocapsae TaxID=34508 RepID=A0A4U5MMI4_STECR|nr:hypothetical protein L596_022687 [Steinernema carpocapsae]
MWLHFSIVLLWMFLPRMDAVPHKLLPNQFNFTLSFPNIHNGNEMHGKGMLNADIEIATNNFALQFNLNAPFSVEKVEYGWKVYERIPVGIRTISPGTDEMGPYRLVWLNDVLPSGAQVYIHYSFTTPMGKGPEDGIYRRILPDGSPRIITHFKDNKGIYVLPMIHYPSIKFPVFVTFVSNQFEDHDLRAWTNYELILKNGNYVPRANPDVGWPVPSYGFAFIIGKYKMVAQSNAVKLRPIKLYTDFKTTQPAQEMTDLMKDAFNWLTAKVGPQMQYHDGEEIHTIRVFIIGNEDYDEMSYRGPQSYPKIIFIPQRYFDGWSEERPDEPYSRELAQFEMVRAIYQQWFFYSITLSSWKNTFIAEGLSAKFALDYFYESRFSRKIDPMAMFLEDKLNDVQEMDTVQNDELDTALYSPGVVDDWTNFTSLDNIYTTYKTVALFRQMEHFSMKHQEFVEGVRDFVTTWDQIGFYVWNPDKFLDFLYTRMKTVVVEPSVYLKWNNTWFSMKYYPVVQVDGYFVECSKDGCLQEGAIMQKLYVPYGFKYDGGATFPLPIQFTLVPLQAQCNLTGQSIFLNTTILKNYDVMTSECLAYPPEGIRLAPGYASLVQIISADAANYYLTWYNDYLMDFLYPAFKDKELNYLSRFKIYRDFRVRMRSAGYPLFIKKFFKNIGWENEIIVWKALEETTFASEFDGSFAPGYMKEMWETIKERMSRFNDNNKDLWQSPMNDDFTNQRIKETFEDLYHWATSYLEGGEILNEEWEDYFQGYLNGSIAPNRVLYPKRLAFRQHASLFGVEGFERLKTIFDRSGDPSDKALILEAMLRTKEAKVLEENFEFILEETIKLKAQRSVFRGAMRNPLAVEFIEGHFKEKPKTKTSRLFHRILAAKRGPAEDLFD